MSDYNILTWLGLSLMSNLITFSTLLFTRMYLKGNWNRVTVEFLAFDLKTYSFIFYNSIFIVISAIKKKCEPSRWILREVQ